MKGFRFLVWGLDARGGGRGRAFNGFHLGFEEGVDLPRVSEGFQKGFRVSCAKGLRVWRLETKSPTSSNKTYNP